jgi:hypothetical protein
MRYIKDYKLFEKNEEFSDVISIVNDILKELNFIDINGRCDISRVNKRHGHYTKHILKKENIYLIIKVDSGKSFNWYDINDVINNASDYLKDNGFTLDSQKTSTWGTGMNSDGIPRTQPSFGNEGLFYKSEIWFKYEE